MFCIKRYQHAKIGFVFASQDSIRLEIVSQHQSECPQQSPVLLVKNKQCFSLGPPRHHSSLSPCRAICKAPSSVALPPMKPLACTKTPPGMPVLALSSSSRRPRHAVGRGFLLAKLPSAADTACTLHLFSVVSCRAVQLKVPGHGVQAGLFGNVIHDHERLALTTTSPEADGEVMQPVQPGGSQQLCIGSSPGRGST